MNPLKWYGGKAGHAALCLFSAVMLLALQGCRDAGLGGTEQGAIAGGAIGAGLGAIVGNQSGHPGAGLAIGSAVGALSGGLIGNQFDQDDDRLKNRDRRMRNQNDELAENRRLIQELRADGAEASLSPRGVVVNLPDVLFEFDKFHLTGSARHKVGEIAGTANKVRDRRISVEGHADSSGTYEYNQKLSELRARTVSEELVRNGVSRKRISSRGLGETRPTVSNDTAAGRRQNRRVEVIIENR